MVFVIKVNPAIVHLLDGDFDGDQMFAILPLNKDSQEDLIKMDVGKFISENPQHFRPGKELKKHKSEKGWATDNIKELNQQIADIGKVSTNGQSLSYHDCINDGLEDGYLDNLNINREELKHITTGIYENDLIGEDETYNIIGAVKSYKLIKQNVAQFGALANAFMALAIHHTWNLCDEDKKKYLDIVGEFKHILCQDGLSAKHGNNKLNSTNGKLLQDMFYCTPDNKLKTREEYEQVLKDINLSEKVIKTILDLFWCEPLTGINKRLNEIVSTYRITRRGTDISLLENMINIKNEQSLQAKMILKGGE